MYQGASIKLEIITIIISILLVPSVEKWCDISKAAHSDLRGQLKTVIRSRLKTASDFSHSGSGQLL